MLTAESFSPTLACCVNADTEVGPPVEEDTQLETSSKPESARSEARTLGMQICSGTNITFPADPQRDAQDHSSARSGLQGLGGFEESCAFLAVLRRMKNDRL